MKHQKKFSRKSLIKTSGLVGVTLALVLFAFTSQADPIAFGAKLNRDTRFDGGIVGDRKVPNTIFKPELLTLESLAGIGLFEGVTCASGACDFTGFGSEGQMLNVSPATKVELSGLLIDLAKSDPKGYESTRSLVCRKSGSTYSYNGICTNKGCRKNAYFSSRNKRVCTWVQDPQSFGDFVGTPVALAGDESPLTMHLDQGKSVSIELIDPAAKVSWWSYKYKGSIKIYPNGNGVLRSKIISRKDKSSYDYGKRFACHSAEVCSGYSLYSSLDSFMGSRFYPEALVNHDQFLEQLNDASSFKTVFSDEYLGKVFSVDTEAGALFPETKYSQLAVDCSNPLILKVPDSIASAEAEKIVCKVKLK